VAYFKVTIPHSGVDEKNHPMPRDGYYPNRLVDTNCIESIKSN
jgi:hypothetical protein